MDKPAKPKRVPITVNVPEGMRDALKEIADKKQTTVSTILRQELVRHIEEERVKGIQSNC